MKFHLIGNPPSSGSSILTRLIDASQHAVCGPELEIFCNRKLYDFSSYKENSDQTSSFFTLQSTGIYPQWDRLKHYGLSKSQFDEMLETSTSLEGFINQFRLWYIHYRSKDEGAVWFEKTPQNLNSVDLFLDNFSDGHFISIFRNPIFTYDSLLRRKRGGNFTALTTWLLYVAKMAPYFDHPRTRILNYETLVEHPYDTTKGLIEDVHDEDVEVNKDRLKKAFANSAYAKTASTGISSWTVQSKTSISNANEREIPREHLEQFAAMLKFRIEEDYARKFKLSPISMEEALIRTGYYEEVMAFLDTYNIKPSQHSTIHRTYADYRKIFAKWVRETGRGNLGVLDLKLLMNPLVKVN